MRKYIKIIGIILLSGFSFFYTEKVTKIVKSKDPIMIKINKIKKEKYIKTIKPIVNNDEYIMGINGCKIDVDESYKKMKTVGEYKEELLVMKEVNNNNLKDKYIISGNKINKEVSIIFLIRDKENEELIQYLSNKRISANFFINQKYLEDNSMVVKFISKDNNIYYLGDNEEYKDKYMMYSKSLIENNSNNQSNYCLINKRDNKILKLCTEYNMKIIKADYIKNDILNSIKERLENGSIIVIDSDDTNMIELSINYILSKGYNIVTLDKLLNNECKEFE